MDKYKHFLDQQDLADNTKKAYFSSVQNYFKQFTTLNKKNLLNYKKFLIANYKPQTVNLRLNAMNYYLRCLKKDKWALRLVKVAQITFIDNVISVADYEFLKQRLKRSKNYKDYFLVRFLCATGARVSEFVHIKVEHVKTGYFDIYGKGNKYRRIYIPLRLQREAMKYLKRDSGYLFLNDKGKPYNQQYIVKRLKWLALKYHINPKVMYPHSFRHRFAKNFILKYNDISMLADILGHESIETTRIYLKKTATEQKDLIDSIVDW